MSYKSNKKRNLIFLRRYYLLSFLGSINSSSGNTIGEIYHKVDYKYYPDINSYKILERDLLLLEKDKYIKCNRQVKPRRWSSM